MTINVTRTAECDRCHRVTAIPDPTPGFVENLPTGWLNTVMPTGDQTVTVAADLCRRCRAQLDQFRQNLPVQAGDPGQPDNPGPPA